MHGVEVSSTKGLVLMPNYDFLCKKCEREQEIFMGIHGVQEPKCASCGNKMSKVYNNSVPVIFKGNGFYSNGG